MPEEQLQRWKSFIRRGEDIRTRSEAGQQTRRPLNCKRKNGYSSILRNTAQKKVKHRPADPTTERQEKRVRKAPG